MVTRSVVFALTVSQELYDLLQSLRARLARPEPDLSVYAAVVSSDLEPWRTLLVHQLSAWNCRVYPGNPLACGLSKNSIAEFSGYLENHWHSQKLCWFQGYWNQDP